MKRFTTWSLAAMIAAVGVCPAYAGPVVSSFASLNEYQPNPVGGDPSDVEVELLGDPGSSFNGWIISIEGDSSSSTGLVDRASQVSGSFDSNGLLVVSVPDFENPTFTTVLSSDFTGAIGTTDVDVDNDGTAEDLSAFGTIYDALGIPDNTGDEMFLYGTDAGGTDFTYTGDEPKLVFRDRETGAWYAVNDEGNVPENVFRLDGSQIVSSAFDMDPEVTTFGAPNPTVPEPSTVVLLGLGVASLAGFRRKQA